MTRAIWFVLALAGCAAAPPAPDEIPVADQASTGEARNRAKIHTDLGLLYLQAGNMATAIQEGRISLDADPTYAPAYNLLGLVHVYLQENRTAAENFERAIRLAPGDPEINNSYGWFLCTQGQEQRGIQHLTTAIKNPLYKTPTRPYTNAGLCSLRLKDDKAAEQYFQRALMMDGDNAQAAYNLGAIAYRHGDYYRAKKYLAEVHRVTEPNAESLWLAVRIERKLGDRQAEAGYASQLRRKFAGSPQYQALMQGQYE